MTVRPASRDLVSGILWAALAGAAWGVSFIAGLMLPGYTAWEISAGRYAAYGLFSAVVLALAVARGRGAILREPRLWLVALAMCMLGKVIYFTAITAAVRFANAPIGSLIIGLLPVAMPLAANLVERSFPWHRLALPAGLMATGLTLVHLGEGGAGAGVAGAGPHYWLGIGLYVAAMLAWTWYGIANARFLARRTDIEAGVWASVQGAVLLPLTLPFIWQAGGDPVATDAVRSWSAFIAVSLLLGVIASWSALVCWNRVTQLLPASIAGQLLVFETIAGLAYAYAWKGAWPPLLVVAGSVALISGVIFGVRALTGAQTQPA